MTDRWRCIEKHSSANTCLFKRMYVGDIRTAMNKSVSFVEILKFLEGSESSRCNYEGERILQAKHLIYCGIKQEGDDLIEIIGLCLQTSSSPHMIEAILSF